MKKNLFVLLIAALSFGFAQAQTTEKKEHVIRDVKSQPVSAERGASKIVKDVPTTDVPVPQPDVCVNCNACNFTFDNWTGYWIKVYVDGQFKGYLEPWGSGTAFVRENSNGTWYCETAGGTLCWEGKNYCGLDEQINLRE